MKMDNMSLPSLPDGWKWSTLDRECKINLTRSAVLRNDNEPTSFIPMTSVDDKTGTITEIIERPYLEVKRGYTYFEENDIIFAKITPCMQNGKHAIAKNLRDGIGFGSTEFHVIKPGPNVLPQWIHAYLRQPRILDEAKRYMTGSVGQQRVPESFLSSLPLPLPPYDVQERIITKLSKQLATIEKTQYLLDEQSRLIHKCETGCLSNSLPDPHGSLLDGWVWGRLGKHVSKVGSGLTPLGGHTAYLDKGIPLIRSQNIYNNSFSRDGLVHISQEQDLIMDNSRVFKGDVLLNITGASIGRVCVVPDDIIPANVNQHVCIIRCLNDLEPQYLALYLSTPAFYKHIMQLQSGATRQALTKAQIEQFPVPIGPIEEQKLLVNYINKQLIILNSIKNYISIQRTDLEKLRGTVLEEAFMVSNND